MLKYLLRLFILCSVISHCADPCMADAPLIWGPSNSALLLNSGNLVGANGNIYVQSDNAVVASTAIIADAMGYLTSSATTATEISYVHGVTSAIQTQLNGKQATLTPGTISTSTTGVSVGSGASSTVGPNVTLNVQTASGSQPGLLSAADWTTFNSKGSGSVSSVGFAGAGGIFSVSGSPITGSGTITESVAGTSGGIPYFSTAAILSSSGALTASQLVLGGGAGAAPTSLAAGAQYSVLTMGASVPGYGSVNLAQSAAVTGLLPVANGGTGLGTLTANNVILGAGTSTPTFVAPGTSGNALLSNGTTWASTAITQGLPTTYEAANFNAAMGNIYLVNTTSAGITATLPTCTSTGLPIVFVDDAGQFGINNLTITPFSGSQTIQGITTGSSLVANLAGAWVQMSCDTTNSYWTVTANGFNYDAVASATQQGIVSTTTQTFAGNKTFNGTITPSAGIVGNTSGTAIGAGLVGNQLLANASGLTFTNNIVKEITSVTVVTTGLYTVTGYLYVVPGTSSTVTAVEWGTSNTSGTLPVSAGPPDSTGQSFQGASSALTTTTGTGTYPISFVVLLPAGTVIHLTGVVSFTGTATGGGYIQLTRSI
jgi:hypothetical protein